MMTTLAVRIPANLKTEIELLAQNVQSTVSDIVREALEKRVKTMQTKKNTDLFQLATFAQSLPLPKKAPADLSTTYKKYLYGQK